MSQEKRTALLSKSSETLFGPWPQSSAPELAQEDGGSRPDQEDKVTKPDQEHEVTEPDHKHETTKPNGKDEAAEPVQEDEAVESDEDDKMSSSRIWTQNYLAQMFPDPLGMGHCEFGTWLDIHTFASDRMQLLSLLHVRTAHEPREWTALDTHSE